MDLWIVGQIGIVIEFVGAALGVYFAWATRQEWSRRPEQSTYGSLGSDLGGPRTEFIDQYRKQVWVFALIGFGLALQFIGNFAK